MKALITFCFKSGPDERVFYKGSKQSFDEIVNVIMGSFDTDASGYLKIPSSDKLIHFIRLSEVRNVIFEIEDETET